MILWLAERLTTSNKLRQEPYNHLTEAFLASLDDTGQEVFQTILTYADEEALPFIGVRDFRSMLISMGCMWLFALAILRIPSINNHYIQRLLDEAGCSVNSLSLKNRSHNYGKKAESTGLFQRAGKG